MLFTDTLARQVMDQAPDAIMVADRAGVVCYWNESAERIFGFTAAAALGQTLDLIIPERHRQRHWDGYHQTMASGITKYGTKMLTVPALHCSNAQLTTEFSIVMLKDAQGQPQGVAAIMRDISAKRAEEKALRDRLAALEAEQGAACQSP